MGANSTFSLYDYFYNYFGNLVKIPTDGIPYPIFVYSALVLWGLFSESISRSGVSLITEAQLITKVYFPRLIIPLAAVGSAWIDFVISLFLPKFAVKPLALAMGI